MANLLDRASIVLTPTAYNNGEALCIKPDDGSGDFQFSRNSAATRVNAQGLVENVQILSSNLVQNGDFSEEGAEEVSNGSFSQEGSELITNGNFDTDSDWGLGANWNISNGKANAVSALSLERLQQFNLGQSINRPYKVTFSVSNLTQGSFKVWFGSVQSQTITSDGDYTIYLTPTTTEQIFIYTIGTTTGSIDNFSVREVGQDWTLGTGWSIGEDKASSDGSQTSNSSLFQPNVLTQNKYYKFEFTLSNVTSGSVRLRNGIGDSETYISYQNSNGTYTAYSIVNSSNKTLVVDADSSFNGSITNISVKEVGQNWTLGDGWSIGDGVAVATSGAASKLTQSISGLSGKKCSVTFTLSNYGGNGTIKLDFGSVVGQNINANGTYTEVGTYDIDRLEFFKNSSFSGSITNISVIEITDDTNLPRINYEGFSYQDALGSEEIVNGDFSNGSTDWSFLGDTIIQNGVAEFPTSTNSFLIQSNAIPLSVKTYKLQYEVITTNGNDFRLAGGNSAFGTVFLDSATIGVKTIYIVSNGTNVNLQFNNDNFIGSIDNVSVKEYLGQEVVPDSGCGSWLFEPQSTNLIPYSETLGNNTTSGGISFTYNNSISPDGTQNAALVSVTSANDRLQPSFAAVNSLVAISIFLKHNGTDFSTQINTFNTGTGTLFGARAHVTATDVTFTSYSGGFDSASFVDYGNGWFRVIVVCQSTTGTTFVQWRPTSVNATLSYPCFGFQVEVQDFATSYIKTDSGSTVTRNQDLCTNGGSLASINSTEGVLYAEIAALANDGTTRFLGLNDGSNSNRVVILYFSSTNKIRAIVSSGGTKYVDINYQLTNILDFHKVAIKYKLNDFAFWIDGVEVATDTSLNAPIGLDRLDFLLAGANNFFGKTKALAVFPYLSDQELTALTTI